MKFDKREIQLAFRERLAWRRASQWVLGAIPPLYALSEVSGAVEYAGVWKHGLAAAPESPEQMLHRYGDSLQ